MAARAWIIRKFFLDSSFQYHFLENGNTLLLIVAHLTSNNLHSTVLKKKILSIINMEKISYILKAFYKG